MALAGANASDFGQSNNCGSSLAAGSNCTISVTFTPSASGTRRASLSVMNTAGTGLQTVSLTGTGAAGAAVSLSSTSLAFGDEPAALTSAPQSVTLTNTGGVALNITSIAITGANASDFAETNTCGSAVAAGAHCTMAVLFTPSAAGARAATLSIADNASGGTQTVALSGTGTHDVIVSWSPSVTAGVVGYYVYRGTTSGGESSSPLNSTPVSGTSFADQAVAAGSTYYYVVTAVASNGVTQSAPSPEASAVVPTP
jgi:methionine-rich copper-binding protein CopC